MKSGVKYKWNRRDFLKASVLLAISTQFIQACKRGTNKLFLKLTGTNHILGHRLRFPDFPKPNDEFHIPYLILGGGIAGLSAAYQLKNNGISDYLLIEMEDKLGGNSKSSENKHSKYPLGAHYLPIPNASNKELYTFLERAKIVTGWTADQTPIFDEEQLSFTPQSRLFIHNYWQSGVIPEYGLEEDDLKQTQQFFSQMQYFSNLKGLDNKFVFDIPTLFASEAHDFWDLDQISMAEWMKKEGYSSKYLFDYVNYACRDDFGTGVNNSSAFAGIHYFSSRKHDYFPNDDRVLTWQEGNGRLVEKLMEIANPPSIKNNLAYKIEQEKDIVKVYVYDSKDNKSTIYTTNKLINCCPQFVNQYLIPERKEKSKQCQYAPWLVASIVLDEFPASIGESLSWDNVIYGANGLGYIYNQHQSVAQFKSPFVLSYYHSLDGKDLKKERQKLYDWTEEQWKDFIIKDLSIAHYGIEKHISSIEVYRLGHGMISPVPGYLSSNIRKDLAKPIGNQIYFAHSDLSGLSLFEEAFYRGIQAADYAVN